MFVTRIFGRLTNAHAMYDDKVYIYDSIINKVSHAESIFRNMTPH